MQIVNYNLGSLVGGDIQIVSKDESYVRRALHQSISFEEYEFLLKTIKYIGASDRFKDVIDLFKVPEGETPAGFKIEYNMKENHYLEIDLVRNISTIRTARNVRLSLFSPLIQRIRMKWSRLKILSEILRVIRVLSMTSSSIIRKQM